MKRSFQKKILKTLEYKKKIYKNITTTTETKVMERKEIIINLIHVL